MDDIARERANSKLNTVEITNLLFGGEFIVQRMGEIRGMITSDPALQMRGYEFLDREDKYDRSVKLSTYLLKTKLSELGINHYLEKVQFFRESLGTVPPFDFTERIFYNTVNGQGTQEQKDKWLPLAGSGKILTCYAQTELGHGTFVRGLETTATYDSTTQEFIIHSPTLTSTKWWSGCLGIAATHGIVVARLITNGEDKGTHNFIVQLRSMENHEPLKGVIIGDIGPKFGFVEKDNGYARFDHFRIPRDNLLMRFARVDPDGTYTRRLSSKLGYGSMVQLRAFITFNTFEALARGTTIAIRYSVVRRQTQNRPGALETQLLDYTNQQFILIPLLATTYALYFVARRIIALLGETQAQLEQDNLTLLPEMHASSAGLKAVSTTAVSQGIEACRIACGGHGYSQSSGFPELYSNISASMTYEGDNNILLLQTARYLLKMVNELSHNPNHPLSDNVKYLTDNNCIHRPYSLIFTSSQQQLSLYRGMVRASVHRAHARVLDGEKRGLDTFDAWNQAAPELIQCAEAHTYYVIAKSFIESLEMSGVTNMCFENQRIMKKLSDIFSLHYMLQKSGVFIESGVIHGSDLVELREVLVSLFAEIRTEAVSLVDAFNYPDFVLRSVLGRKDGDVYRAMWDWVQDNPRNKHPDGVHPVYHKYVKQLLASKL
ncbi:Peroxisomal acyl-coenzyme A oxidase 1 [Oopsacas minuta]|uniref:Acyl-coenzyme A oxidase n=1 Tax=Oopsacas minuta TaxID=111878 RepID=A0AAV7KM62_9METZ|nr:Peroxisomal acyl-coenzyme A oxidase 1 [Oopsacas minuta]